MCKEKVNKVNIILGTMTFGEQLFEDAVKDIIENFIDLGYKQLDTAYVYNDGRSEQLIGYAIKEFSRDNLLIDSKVNPRITGKLDANAVSLQLEGSLARLGTDYLDTYYIHFPDRNSRIEDVLEKIDEYYHRGYIKELGLSNFPADLVKYVCKICNENKWVKPTAYEGLYNPFSRRAENELNEVLYKNNIRFNCYNPLAGGILTNKYSSFEEKPSKGRFTHRPNYMGRYWKESFFKALDDVKNACSKCGISIVEATFRWLSHSSMLDDRRHDGIIIGVSKNEHLQQNINSINCDRLPEEVIKSFDNAWEICRKDAPEYYKFYGETN